ncbi:hypothetical protein GCM10008955_00920 [Deinococcus malanensis]|uniref:Uncharacterized protein n=1 Tax=Deinococcus malanensis TaxID=1706855 RepID=A0ABQ2EGD5_9DEIO|nr:hypothetical protein GCM10008955_00920 [Deinococcus malanensis]
MGVAELVTTAGREVGKAFEADGWRGAGGTAVVGGGVLTVTDLGLTGMVGTPVSGAAGLTVTRAAGAGEAVVSAGLANHLENSGWTTNSVLNRPTSKETTPMVCLSVHCIKAS